MVCVQLMLQTEPLGAVLALVGFLCPASLIGVTLRNVLTSFNMTPCTALTCSKHNACVERWRCDIVAVWLVTRMSHHSFGAKMNFSDKVWEVRVFTSLFMLRCCCAIFFFGSSSGGQKIWEYYWLWMQRDWLISCKNIPRCMTDWSMTNYHNTIWV